MEYIYNDEEEIHINPEVLDRALKHFNWGAFGYTWIWGLGNGSFWETWYISIFDTMLLFTIYNTMILPIAGVCSLSLRIFYGIKGNKWAYEKRAWCSLEDFISTQKFWAKMTVPGVVFYVTIFMLIDFSL